MGRISGSSGLTSYRGKATAAGLRSLVAPLLTASGNQFVNTQAPSTGGYSAWVQLVDNTALTEAHLLQSLQVSPSNAATWGVEIGVGAAGAEVVVAEFVNVISLGGGVPPYLTPTFPQLLPALTRVSVRSRSSYTGGLNQITVGALVVPLSTLEAF